MDRSYAILGVKEDATKQQVRDAYERRLKKYKAADYDDEPEYAARKIAELKNAYERAYKLAGGADVSADTGSDVSGQVRPKPSASHVKAHRDDDKGKFFEREIHPERKYNKKICPADIGAGLKSLGENLGGSISKTFSEHTGKSTYRPRKNRPANEKTMLIKILSIAVAILTIGGAVLGIISDYDPVESDYSIEYVNQDDKMIHTIALDSRDYIYENFRIPADDEITGSGNEEKDLKQAADEFAQKYAGRNSIEEWTDYLNKTYPDNFWTEYTDPIDMQLEDILRFYDFESYYYAEGFVNPYTDEIFESLYDYIDFLNEYYHRELEDSIV